MTMAVVCAQQRGVGSFGVSNMLLVNRKAYAHTHVDKARTSNRGEAAYD